MFLNVGKCLYVTRYFSALEVFKTIPHNSTQNNSNNSKQLQIC